MLTNFPLVPDEPFEVPCGNRTERHIFNSKDILAIEAALLTGRPLLVYGEPGIGKSQLARAAAICLDRNFRAMVVDAATEARDLRWREDLVGRLAKAQYIGALNEEQARKELDELNVQRFVWPGPLWYGFNWVEAVKQEAIASGKSVNSEALQGTGTVVLIDEIDKAESDVPNGLLEALGAREFTPPGANEPIVAKHDPLVVITTNDERPLPTAFVRRCVVHHMKLPEEPISLISELVRRGKAHFPKGGKHLETAAKMLAEDRAKAIRLGLRQSPGVAEYIDLLNALFSENLKQGSDAEKTLEKLRDFCLRKHPALKE